MQTFFNITYILTLRRDMIPVSSQFIFSHLQPENLYLNRNLTRTRKQDGEGLGRLEEKSTLIRGTKHSSVILVFIHRIRSIGYAMHAKWEQINTHQILKYTFPAWDGFLKIYELVGKLNISLNIVIGSFMQGFSLLLAISLRAFVPQRRLYDEHDEEYSAARNPLLNSQDSMASASASVGNNTSHSDSWRSQMRQKVFKYFSFIF